MPSRMQRATRAYAFLAKYPSYDRCDLRSSVVDLLADLLHLCESQGIAGDAAFSLAQRHCDNDRDDDASPLTRFTITAVMVVSEATRRVLPLAEGRAVLATSKTRVSLLSVRVAIMASISCPGSQFATFRYWVLGVKTGFSLRTHPHARRTQGDTRYIPELTSDPNEG